MAGDLPVTISDVLVFSSVCVCDCLSVRLSVNAITPEPLDITKFPGHHPMLERADKFENGYIGCAGSDLSSLMFHLIQCC